MTQTELEVDYLIIGAGAMGLAFADTVVAESDKTVAIVDMHHRPGGHWNDAYPFVTLHQPSAYYGVPSRELSKNKKDTEGLNKGLYDLATGPEIMAYFDAVMRETLLPSGQVTYLPSCKYQGDGKVSALLGNKTWHITAREKTVDATWLKTTVPSTHVPNFEIAEGVDLRPLNDLPRLSRRYAEYTVIGGGKTGIDAVIWLLENHVDPDTINWIMPRDAWLMNRATTQPEDEFFMQTMGAQANIVEAIAKATNLEDLFKRLELAGVFVRLDESVRPKMFHGATISLAERDLLRSVRNIIRKGRVKRLEPGQMIMDGGVIKAHPDTLYVDCSACALGNTKVVPIFGGDTIYLQTVRSVQPVFSAAFIAHIELTRDSEDEKNRLCQIVPLPNHDIDWLRMQGAMMMNQYAWSQESDLRGWLLNNRLDGYSRMVVNASRNDAEKMAVLAKFRQNAMPAMGNLQKLLAEAG